VDSRIDPSTIFHLSARPLSRPATREALQLWAEGSKLMVICTAPLANCITPTSLSPAKRKLLPDSPGPCYPLPSPLRAGCGIVVSALIARTSWRRINRSQSEASASPLRLPVRRVTICCLVFRG
jgi:hypothetical protein